MNAKQCIESALDDIETAKQDLVISEYETDSEKLKVLMARSRSSLKSAYEILESVYWE